MLPVIGVPFMKRSWRSCHRTRLFQLLWMMFIGIGWVETAWIHITEDDEKGVLHMHPFDGGKLTKMRMAITCQVIHGLTRLFAAFISNLRERKLDTRLIITGRNVSDRMLRVVSEYSEDVTRDEV